MMSTTNNYDSDSPVKTNNDNPRRARGGGKRSGFDAFARNEKAMELLNAYLSGEIKNQEIFLTQLREANVKICLRTLKNYLSIAKIRRSRKGCKRGSTPTVKNEYASVELDGMAEEEERKDESRGEHELDEAEPESLLDLDMDEFAGGNWQQLQSKCYNIGANLVAAIAHQPHFGGIGTSSRPMDISSQNSSPVKFITSPTKSMASSNYSTPNNRGINQYLNPATMAAEFVNALEEDNKMKAELKEAPEKLLDAALEWIMADEKAMGILGTEAFKKFFGTICKIQREHMAEGNNDELEFPEAEEIAAALDRHLAKIAEQRMALDHQQSRILGLRRSLGK